MTEIPTGPKGVRCGEYLGLGCWEYLGVRVGRSGTPRGGAGSAEGTFERLRAGSA